MPCCIWSNLLPVKLALYTSLFLQVSCKFVGPLFSDELLVYSGVKYFFKNNVVAGYKLHS